MARWGGSLVAAAVIVGTASGAAAQQRYVNADTVVVMPSLQALADTATREYGRCLYGSALTNDAADTLYFVDAALPPAFSNRAPDEPRTSVTFVCNALDLIGGWHNHVLREYRRLPLGPWSWPGAPTEAAEACQLSSKDLQSAMAPGAPPITVISVDRRTFCWWFKAELLQQFGDGTVTNGVTNRRPLPMAVRPDSAHLRTDWGDP